MPDRATFGWTPARMALVAVIALAVYGGYRLWWQANYTPDPSFSAPLLDHVFAEKHSVLARGPDGSLAFPNLTRADIDQVTQFDCFDTPDKFRLTRTDRFNRPPPTFDCVYQLTGTDGASYVSVVRLVYLSEADLKLMGDLPAPTRDVGPYGVGEVPADQAVELLLGHKIALP